MPGGKQDGGPASQRVEIREFRGDMAGFLRLVRNGGSFLKIHPSSPATASNGLDRSLQCLFRLEKTLGLSGIPRQSNLEWISSIAERFRDGPSVSKQPCLRLMAGDDGHASLHRPITRRSHRLAIGIGPARNRRSKTPPPSIGMEERYVECLSGAARLRRHLIHRTAVTTKSYRRGVRNLDEISALFRNEVADDPRQQDVEVKRIRRPLIEDRPGNAVSCNCSGAKARRVARFAFVSSVRGTIA